MHSWGNLKNTDQDIYSSLAIFFFLNRMLRSYSAGAAIRMDLTSAYAVLLDFSLKWTLHKHKVSKWIFYKAEKISNFNVI